MFKRIRFTVAALILLSACAAGQPVLADSGADSAGEERALRLAAAYQSGYLNVTATACFQLYSSMGIIAGDLAAGYITGATALSALEQNGLLLSVCQSSLEEVQLLTGADDKQGTELLLRIGGMLEALGGLHSALVGAATAPRGDAQQRQAAERAVDTARAAVETALENFAKPLEG